VEVACQMPPNPLYARGPYWIKFAGSIGIHTASVGPDPEK